MGLMPASGHDVYFSRNQKFFTSKPQVLQVATNMVQDLECAMEFLQLTPLV
jgi:hypothetical protein